MSKILAYLHTSTDKQGLNCQNVENLDCARPEDIHIDDIIAVAASSERSKWARCIDKLPQRLATGDWLVVAELSRLGRSTGIERMMISRRPKAALAAHKAREITLGKPKGTIQDSICNKDRERVVDLPPLGVSTRHVSTQHLGYRTPSRLNYYVRIRKLRALAEAART